MTADHEMHEALDRLDEKIPRLIKQRDALRIVVKELAVRLGRNDACWCTDCLATMAGFCESALRFYEASNASRAERAPKRRLPMSEVKQTLVRSERISSIFAKHGVEVKFK
jgi:hypothetical protein